jgi:hypothetical protein
LPLFVRRAAIHRAQAAKVEQADQESQHVTGSNCLTCTHQHHTEPEVSCHAGYVCFMTQERSSAVAPIVPDEI